MMSASSTSGPVPQGAAFRHGLMLVVAIAFLTVIGLVLPQGDSGEAFRGWFMASRLFLPLIITLWAIVIIEGIAGLFVTHDALPARLKRLLLTALLPPL